MEDGQSVEEKVISTIHKLKGIFRSDRLELKVNRFKPYTHTVCTGFDDMTKNDPGIVIAGMICLFLLKST